MGMLCCIHGILAGEIRRLQQDDDALEDFLEESDDVCDVDKAWHGIHFLLTGDAWGGDPPFNFLLCGGTLLGGSDDGVSPPRYFDPREVADVYRALESVTVDELRKRFDPRKLAAAEIYPDIWDRVDKEPWQPDYLTGGFEQMKEFFKTLAEAKKGAIITIR